MNCANCGAAMRRDIPKDCLVCDFCRSTWFPSPNSDGVRLFEQAVDVDCPLCKVPLFEASIEGCPVQFCRECNGILVQGDAFLVVQSALRLNVGRPLDIPRPADAHELDRQMQCPVCGRQM